MKNLFLALLFSFANAFVLAQGYRVDKFLCDITINEDGSFDVVEDYDIFFTEPRHGIIRTIISSYDFQDKNKTTTNRKLEFTDVEVLNQKFSKTMKIKEKLTGKMEIKIGAPNQLVSGNQHYTIKYKVKNGLIQEDSLTAFYWNVKSPEWDATFKSIEFNIRAPKDFFVNPENSYTYSGDPSQSQISDKFKYQYDGETYSATCKASFISVPGQSVTVLIKMPASFFKTETVPPKTIKSYSWLAILLGIFILFWLVWEKLGKDKRVVAITSYYPPENIDPALAGYLMKDGFDANQLIALIPKWGADGLLIMKEVPKDRLFGKRDIELLKLRELPSNSIRYERTIFNGLFSNYGTALSSYFKDEELAELEELENEEKSNSLLEEENAMLEKQYRRSVRMGVLKDGFYKVLKQAEEQLTTRAKDYYEVSGERAKSAILVTSIILAVVLPVFMFLQFGWIAGISSLITCLIIAGLSYTMRKKNPKGDKAYAELLGFYRFVKLADATRLKILLSEDAGYFEKTMSYALAFGLLDTWASKFDGLLSKPPSYYKGNDDSSIDEKPYDTTHFRKSFSNSVQTLRTAMISSPATTSVDSIFGEGSSGGGFSGGGFGSGGGKSW